MAGAEVVVEVLSQPLPEPPLGLPDLAVPKVLQYLYLASAWVACASVAAATVARRAWGEASPVCYAFLKVSIGALLFPALLIVVFSLRLLRAMRATGFRLSLNTWAKEIQIQARKIFGALTWEVLRDTTVLGWLACFPFFLLLIAGVLVFTGLLPVEGSQRERIGYALFDAGVLGTMAMFCFIIIPSFVLKLWRSK